jgi:Tfp pilus assembly protein PilV
MKLSQKRGISMIEIIIGSTILVTAFVVLIQVYGIFVKTSLSNMNKIQAAFLLEEGQEAVRVIRDQSWSTKIATLTDNIPYYLSWNGTSWVSTTTSSMIDGKFARTFILEKVYRNNNKDIVSSGTLDTNIKKVTVSVAWKDGSTATTTKSVSNYFTNIFSN